MSKQIKKEFKALEDVIDQQLAKLSIWALPFQTVMSYLFYGIENIDLKGDADTAMDYTSRLSYLYQVVVGKAQNTPPVSSNSALRTLDTTIYAKDINFLNAAAHYSLLMPQFHRSTMTITSKDDDKHYTIDFPSDAVRDAEIMDRALSYISLQMVIEHPYKDKLSDYLSAKVDAGNQEINGTDFAWVKTIYDFYYRTLINVKVLPDAVFEQQIGVSYDEYYRFSAAMRAFASFFIALGRTYYHKINMDDPQPNADELMLEYIEWTICSFNHKVIGWVQGMCELDSEKFKKVISYFLSIYSDTTAEGFYSESYSGDGYFPPVIWQDDSILFSPHAWKYMLTPNNILYSINKLDANRFSRDISHHLEPSLISQLEYIFKSIPDVKSRPNINYPGSEVDLMVMKESENVVISMQVKATIAPDSARTVQRVEGRALEGIEQIEFWEKQSTAEQETIINNHFGTKLKDIKIIHVLLMRSSAGSADAWARNEQYPIANYSLLGWLLAGKKETGNGSLLHFDDEIRAAQKEIVAMSDSKIEMETLSIGEYSITFPNVDGDLGFIATVYGKIFKYFPEFQEVFI
jgi:hypothetical protein